MVSRQREWQRTQIKKGNCIQCARPRNRYRHHCDECAVKHRVYTRAFMGARPWEPGSCGRIPYGREADQERYYRKHYGRLADRIYALYWEKQKTMNETADILKISTTKVFTVMRKFDIPRRRQGPRGPHKKKRRRLTE